MKTIRKYAPELFLVLVLAGAITVMVKWYHAQPGLGRVPMATEPSRTEVETLDSLTMSVDSREGSTFFLTFRNETDANYEFGWGCGLEKELDGTWYALEREVEVCFTAEAYLIPANGGREWEEKVDYYAQSLNEGRYRLLKTVIAPGEPGDQERFRTIAAEFTVD